MAKTAPRRPKGRPRLEYYPPRERDAIAEGLELKRIRERILDWSKKDTSAALAVSDKTYGRWEKGESCQWTALMLMRLWAEAKKRGA